MVLSIIVPVFNEGKTIAAVLTTLADLSLIGVILELIVVDDGSKDTTWKEIETAKRKIPKLIVLRHDRNLGKGAAVLTGIKKATGDYLLIQDADLEYDPSEIKLLIEPILARKARVVYGTRLRRLPNFTRDERTPTFFLHYVGNRILSLVTSVLYGQWVTDMETGYKLLPKTLMDTIKLRAKSFDFEPEITAKILKRGFRICEVPISTNPRDHTEGKKLIAMRDGPVALWTLIKYRFSD